MDTIKRVLLAGMHKPDVSRSWPSIFRLKVQVKAQRRLYAADLLKEFLVKSKSFSEALIYFNTLVSIFAEIEVVFNFYIIGSVWFLTVGRQVQVPPQLN